MRDTPYAREIRSTGDEFGAKIERIYVKHLKREEIRFSWWKDGRFAPRPLDIPESELLPLMRKAIKEGVFTPKFVADLCDALKD